MGERVDSELWRELGAPQSLKAAMADSEKRWMKFIRSREYRNRCGTDVIALIEDYRRRTNRMLIVLGASAGLILYRFWPLLKPSFL